jgi:CRP-like cAMP-binding protein
MVAVEKLFQYFDNYVSLNELEKLAFAEKVKPKKVKRKQYLLQENDVCKYYTFVVEGLLKMYVCDTNVVEHNLQFAAENEWISDISSIHNKTPSRMCIEALEDSYVLQIESHDLHVLMASSINIERNFRVIIENKYVALEERVINNLCLTTEQKYLQFIDKYTNLTSRLPNTQIASYLGITPEFLSKIRNGISRK